MGVNEGNEKNVTETVQASKTSHRARRRSSEEGKVDQKNNSQNKNQKLLRTKRKLGGDEKEEAIHPVPSKAIKIHNDNLALNCPIDNWSWERVIGSGNCELSELLIDKDAINCLGEGDINGGLASEHQKLVEKEQKESLDNPTPAMKTIMK